MKLLSASRHVRAFHVLVVLLATASISPAADSYPAQVSVSFSPHGGCTDAIVRELGAAHRQVLRQAAGYRKAKNCP